MQIIKYLGTGALILVLLVLIASLLLPSSYVVKRSCMIRGSKNELFKEVADYSNWVHWSPWMEKDSTVKNTIDGSAMSIGHNMHWTSNKSGNGSLVITAVNPSDSVRMQLQYNDMDMHSDMQFILEQKGDSVSISLISSGELKFMSRIFGLLFDKMLGGDYERGLSRLKAYIESNANTPSLKVEAVTVPARMVMLVSEKCATAEIGKTLGRLYGEIGVQIGMQGLSMAGAPFAIYDSYDLNTVALQAGILINKPGQTVDRVVYTELPETKAIKADFYGPYTGLHDANQAMQTWLKTNKYKVSGSCWEVYVTDPLTEKDSTKILTQIYYPIN